MTASAKRVVMIELDRVGCGDEPDTYGDEGANTLGNISRGTFGNYPASGAEIIKVMGETHLRTGQLIVYTSAADLILGN